LKSTETEVPAGAYQIDVDFSNFGSLKSTETLFNERVHVMNPSMISAISAR